MAHQGTTTPVLSDVREQTVLELVPLAGAWGKWQTVICKPDSSAKRWRATFHKRLRLLLLPPPSAAMRSSVASGYEEPPIVATTAATLQPQTPRCHGRCQHSPNLRSDSHRRRRRGSLSPLLGWENRRWSLAPVPLGAAILARHS